MRLAHLLVCHSVQPTKLLASIPPAADSFWYVFLHGRDPTLADDVSCFVDQREGNLFPYGWNRGLAASWNQGMHLAMEAGCEAVLLLNDDLFFYDGGYTAFRATVEALRTLSTNVAFVTTMGLESGASPHAGETLAQSFACCAITKEAIERVGYFDETFFPAYYEDFDYKIRTEKAGMTMHVDTRVLVEHERMSTSRALRGKGRADLMVAIDRNRRYFERKWRDSQDPFATPFDDPGLDLRIPFERRAAPYGAVCDPIREPADVGA